MDFGLQTASIYSRLPKCIVINIFVSGVITESNRYHTHFKELNQEDRELLTQFSNFLKGKHCQVFASPFDLRLPNAGEEDEDTTNVYQPDLVVVCDQSKLKGTGYYGTPELVIEILSPITIRNDKIWKFNKYEMAGVKEYWVVEPEGKFVTVFKLQENNRYGRPEAYIESDEIRVSIFPELLIDLESVFMAIR
ncbi:MAG: Uma2 family endonuclease [Vallitaleaceae bacterium]|nr:Uma2 family endonuclease [Vallitaleaceae bacterium]